MNPTPETPGNPLKRVRNAMGPFQTPISIGGVGWLKNTGSLFNSHS
jgi:hypothetical protein